MATLKNVDGWSIEQSSEVLIFEFGFEMDIDAFGEGAWEAYTDALARERVCAVVTVVETDDPFDAATFDVWKRSGKLAVEKRVEEWAIVGDRLKRMSTKSQLDTKGLSVEGFDDRGEALTWAQPE